MSEEEITEEITEDFEWPDAWRDEIIKAGKYDEEAAEKALAQLGRYKSPAEIWNKARALEAKVTSGELKDNTPFPTDGTDEEKGAWYTTNGIPLTPDKYELSREIEDEEKDVINGFLEYAHGMQMNPAHVNGMLDYFYQRSEEQAKSLDEGGSNAQELADDALRSEWDKEYRGNINRIDNLMATAPGDLKETLLDARLPDGTKLRSNPEAMKFLLDMANFADPVTTVIGGKGGDQLSSVQDEIDEIKELMRTDRKKYDRDEKIQQRYRELLAAQAKLQPQQ